MGAYLGQLVHDSPLTDNCLWMNDRFAISSFLRAAIINRIHEFHYRKVSMFDAARNIQSPEKNARWQVKFYNLYARNDMVTKYECSLYLDNRVFILVSI